MFLIFNFPDLSRYSDFSEALTGITLSYIGLRLSYTDDPIPITSTFNVAGLSSPNSCLINSAAIGPSFTNTPGHFFTSSNQLSYRFARVILSLPPLAGSTAATDNDTSGLSRSSHLFCAWRTQSVGITWNGLGAAVA